VRIFFFGRRVDDNFSHQVRQPSLLEAEPPSNPNWVSSQRRTRRFFGLLRQSTLDSVEPNRQVMSFPRATRLIVRGQMVPNFAPHRAFHLV
jgi:hypothetical protein